MTEGVPENPGPADAPSVSIVIPMLNEERHIAACLDSILAQEFDQKQWEILVVDGRSTDRSREIVQAYAQRHADVRLLDNPGRIQSTAMNIGIRHARGKYILRVDAHCHYHPDYVANVIRAFERTGAFNIAGTFSTRPSAATRIANAIALVRSSRFGAGASFGRQPGPPRMIEERGSVTSGWSFRKELFDRVGLLDERLVRGQDNEISGRCFDAGLGLYFDPTVQAEYLPRSTIRSSARMMFKNGYFLMPMWLIRPSTFTRMHLVPLLFVMTLMLSALGGLAWKHFWWVTTAAMTPYLILNIAVSMKNAVQHGLWVLAYLPWIFPLTHFAYGIGTLAGIVRFGLGRLPRAPAAASENPGIFPAPSTEQAAARGARQPPHG